MENNEMLALVGTIVNESAGIDHFNFYPIGKIVDEKYEILEDDEKKRLVSSYGNFDVNFGASNISDELRKRIVKLQHALYADKRFVCILYLYENDIEPYTTKSGREGKRIYLSKLFQYDENQDIFRGLVKIIPNNKLEQSFRLEDFFRDDREILVKTNDITLEDGEQYFVQRRSLDGYKYAGPIGCVDGELKKPLKYPKERIKKIEGDAIPEYKTGNYFVYYLGESFDFDYSPEATEHENEYEFEFEYEFELEQESEKDPIELKRNELISDIRDYRHYDNNMICNMLICISQGFLTIFAGEPGTGKTSICDKIAQLMGVSRKSKDSTNRYLSISVERGWTSKSDLIGYLNPLADNVVVDATGLYDALDEVSGEKEEAAAPYLVLLDEANLSQMEYYWSTFIKLADDDARRKTPLHFSNEHNFMIPDWFKFLATINNDQTTESLSPRLIDRAWIITLPELDIIGDSNQFDNDCDRIFWDEMQKMFEGVTENSDLFMEAKARLDGIYKIYKEKDKPVSPRSKNAIKSYLKSALSCFEGDTEQKINNAIDYIILQRLLPMLNGYISNEFKEELKAIFNQNAYPLSKKKFEKMCHQEDYTNSSYVNFFI